MENKEERHKDIAEKLAKSLYKMVEKTLKNKRAKTVVQDVLDANNEAEVDTDAIPTAKPSVLWKKDKENKGVNKLKSFVNSKKK